MFETTINNKQKVLATLVLPMDKDGNIMFPSVPPVWTISGTSTLEPRQDGLSCMLISSDPTGDNDITVLALFGEVTASLQIVLHVQEAPVPVVINIGVVFGEPEPK